MTLMQYHSMVTSIILRVVYAKDITDLEDEYVRFAHLGGQGFSEAMVPGAYWVEFLPFLRHIPSWVPGTSARKLAEKYFPYVYYIRDKPYFEVKAAMVSTSPDIGLIIPDLTSDMM